MSLTVVLSPFVWLAWALPLPQLRNGVVRYYAVNLTRPQGQTYQSAVPACPGALLKLSCISNVSRVGNTSTSSTFLFSLDPSVSYLVGVAACSELGCGPPSAPTSFTTLNGPPSLPVRNVSALATATSLTLLWIPPPLAGQGGPLSIFTITLDRSFVILECTHAQDRESEPGFRQLSHAVNLN